ncbi:MAG: prepilin-type N-terminal cleavage/methylation domain-containing protein [Planctomycetota bacterium]|nr:prepilin-type N-terminal cleavage/methylation domain-containing protein [Planctomycetota bacterium]
MRTRKAVVSCELIQLRSPCVPVRGGYSLLELLIVLTVLVGLLAIAWPSLSKPLANSDLLEAGNQLRTQLSEARLLAIQSGEPVIVRIECDSGMITFANWHQAMGPLTLSDADPLDESGEAMVLEEVDTPEIESASGAANVWAIPEGIVVDRVIRQESTSNQDALRDTLGFGDPLDRENGTELETDLLSETDSTGFEESIADPRISWVWFLPQGQACEATLYLVDQDARRELKVQIHAWSGGVELGRPRLVSENLEVDALGFDDQGSPEDDRESRSFAGEDSTLDSN